MDTLTTMPIEERTPARRRVLVLGRSARGDLAPVRDAPLDGTPLVALCVGLPVTPAQQRVLAALMEMAGRTSAVVSEVLVLRVERLTGHLRAEDVVHVDADPHERKRIIRFIPTQGGGSWPTSYR